MFKKQEKPRFFGKLLGTMIKASAPVVGGGLGAYLGSLSTNPYFVPALTSGGMYLGKEGGNALGDLVEQYMPFARGGRLPSRKLGGFDKNIGINPYSDMAEQRKEYKRQLKNMGYTDKEIEEMPLY